MTNCTNTDVTVTGVETIIVTSPGPIGPAGPAGPKGDPGTVSASSGLSVTGSAQISGSLIITGSVFITGSNTLKNEGPTILSGSVNISGSLNVNGPIVSTSSTTVATGSFSGSFSGDGSGLTNIPASALNNASFSKIATGSVTASVNIGDTSYLINVGGSNKFAVKSDGKVGIGTVTPSESLDVNGNLIADTGSFRKGIIVTGSAYFKDLPTQASNTIVVIDPATGRLATTSSQVSAVSTVVENNQSGNLLFATGQEHVISGSSNIRIVNGQSILSVTGSVIASAVSGAFSGSGTNLSDLRIGQPDDNSYGDGFFVEFTSNTKLSNAIDEISEAFLELAPSQAATLSGSNLAIQTPNTFSGYLAAGLDANDWSGSAEYALVSGLTTTSSVVLLASGSTLFKAGRKVSLQAGALLGGVSASIASGSQTLTVVDKLAFGNGNPATGLNNIIRLLGTSVYNSFWVQASASLTHTMSRTGSYRYAISADNGAGTSNLTQLRYVGTTLDFPDQSVSVPVATTGSPIFNYLSGVKYLETCTFGISYTGSNLYNPVYNQNQITITSDYFDTVVNGNNTPNYNSVLISTVNAGLKPNLTSGQQLASGRLTATKPGKPNYTSDFLLSTYPINSYTGSISTNVTNSQTEYFLDEANRIKNLTTRSWDPTDLLANGELESQNGRLICAQYGNYPANNTGGTAAGYAQYFRTSTPGSNYRINGTLQLTVNNNAFASTPLISKWDSAGDLQVALVLYADITGPTTASVVYDLGRPVGDNSGNIKGIRQTINSATGTTYNVTWALPLGITTGIAASAPVTIWVRYSNTANTDYITQMNIVYS